VLSFFAISHIAKAKFPHNKITKITILFKTFFILIV
jgi:hypothetical protein